VGLNTSDQESSAGLSQAQAVSELALELGVSLTLPDLLQAVSSRCLRMFQSSAVLIALSHNRCPEAVLLATSQEVISERKSLTRFNSALMDFFAKAGNAIQTVVANDVFSDDLLREHQWSKCTVALINDSTGEPLAMMCLADSSEVDQGLLGTAVRLIATALENCRLFSQITQASKQWAEIFDSLSDFIVLHDEQHRVMRVNRALADFIGSRPPELIGIHMRDVLSKGKNTGMQPCPFCSQSAQGDEFRHPALDRFYLLSTSRVRGALNESPQTIHVLRDITDRREAERRYQQLFDNVQEGVFFSTPAGKFLEVNDALVSMLGYRNKKELLAIDIPTQLYLSVDERVRTHQAMAPTGELHQKEIQFRRKNGSLMPALVNSFAVRNSAGEVVQYRGMIFDMSEIKRFQTQLQRERDFNLQILNNTQNMILVADTAGLISYANRRCFVPQAYGKTELVGHKISSLVEIADRESWDCAFDMALQGQPVDNLEVQMVLGNGVVGRFSVNLSPMRDQADAVTSVVIVMTDITEAALIQAKLMNTEKLAAVGQLVSGVAHEVNNPLTAIMGFADLMLENPELPQFAHQDLQVIMQEAERTKEIVQNLLSFARQSPPHHTNVDVNAALRRTLALRAYDLSSHSIEVVEEFASDLPHTVGDEQQLVQVFLNILNNAYDAVTETGRTGRIQITTSFDDGNVAIEFKDNGPGVNNIEKIFDPFFTTKPVGKGTGLGLSICYGVIRQHGGEVHCRNNSNDVGATFVIRLPIQPQASAATASRATA
jgi:PAS domain S-box-containing protein